ncbi:unnamed protein product [Trichogramma brassicae]|uniref:Uncharacterized protein n=1 Tax=Trichogramma brassicae TaxID=86971 RepID=A0A6H5IUD6_9HYME|nr:unnamed protein product [Trichogramma brassicae]
MLEEKDEDEFIRFIYARVCYVYTRFPNRVAREHRGDRCCFNKCLDARVLINRRCHPFNSRPIFSHATTIVIYGNREIDDEISSELLRASSVAAAACVALHNNSPVELGNDNIAIDRPRRVDHKQLAPLRVIGRGRLCATRSAKPALQLVVVAPLLCSRDIDFDVGVCSAVSSVCVSVQLYRVCSVGPPHPPIIIHI